jgi:hypothetical protein
LRKLAAAILSASLLLSLLPGPAVAAPATFSANLYKGTNASGGTCATALMWSVSDLRKYCGGGYNDTVSSVRIGIEFGRCVVFYTGYLYVGTAWVIYGDTFAVYNLPASVNDKVSSIREGTANFNFNPPICGTPWYS